MGAQQDDETESLPALTLEQCIAQIDDWANQNIAKSADAANAFRHCAQFLKERCKAEPPIESGRCPQLYRLTDAAVEDMTLEQATARTEVVWKGGNPIVRLNFAQEFLRIDRAAERRAERLALEWVRDEVVSDYSMGFATVQRRLEELKDASNV